MSFGEAAARLAGMASQLLGWRPDHFWNCTPMELVIAMNAGPTADTPDAETIEALRRRFPDDCCQIRSR
jgi:uncharacterized phage protein (TIGR02216 family)